MATVGTVIVTLGADIASFTRGFAAAGAQLNSFSSRLSAAGTRVRTLGLQLSLALTAPLAAAGRALSSSAGDFDRTLTQIQTLAAGSAEQVARLREELVTIGPQLSRGPNELAKAIYNVYSNGIQGAQAMEVLTNSAKASVIGLGDTATVARAVTSALQAFRSQNLSAAEATEILIGTVEQGAAEVTSIASAFGRVQGIAASVGLTFQDVGGFIAAFTRQGVSAEEAVTSLRGLLTAFVSPTQASADALSKLGLTAGMVREQIKENGLAQAFVDLTNSAAGNITALEQIIPNVRALAGLLGTAGVQGQKFVEISNDVGRAIGTLDERFRVARQSIPEVFNELRARAEAASVSLGTALAPAALEIVRALNPIADQARELGRQFQLASEPAKRLAVQLIGVVAAIGPGLVIFGTLARVIALLISPVGLLVTAMSAVVAANSEFVDSLVRSAEEIPIIGRPLADAAALFQRFGLRIQLVTTTINGALLAIPETFLQVARALSSDTAIGQAFGALTGIRIDTSGINSFLETVQGMRANFDRQFDAISKRLEENLFEQAARDARGAADLIADSMGAAFDRVTDEADALRRLGFTVKVLANDQEVKSRLDALSLPRNTTLELMLEPNAEGKLQNEVDQVTTDVAKNPVNVPVKPTIDKTAKDDVVREIGLLTTPEGKQIVVNVKDAAAVQESMQGLFKPETKTIGVDLEGRERFLANMDRLEAEAEQKEIDLQINDESARIDLAKLTQGVEVQEVLPVLENAEEFQADVAAMLSPQVQPIETKVERSEYDQLAKDLEGSKAAGQFTVPIVTKVKEGSRESFISEIDGIVKGLPESIAGPIMELNVDRSGTQKKINLLKDEINANFPSPFKEIALKIVAQNEAEALGKLPTVQEIRLDLRGAENNRDILNSEIKALQGQVPDVELRIKAAKQDQFVAEMKAKIKRLEDTGQLDAAIRAKAELEEFTSKIEAIPDPVSTTSVDVDADTSKAETKLDRLVEKAGALNRELTGGFSMGEDAEGRPIKIDNFSSTGQGAGGAEVQAMQMKFLDDTVKALNEGSLSDLQQLLAEGNAFVQNFGDSIRLLGGNTGAVDAAIQRLAQAVSTLGGAFSSGISGASQLDQALSNFFGKQHELKFNVTAEGSPKLSFSDYFDRYAPEKLRALTKEDFNVPFNVRTTEDLDRARAYAFASGQASPNENSPRMDRVISIMDEVADVGRQQVNEVRATRQALQSGNFVADQTKERRRQDFASGIIR